MRCALLLALLATGCGRVIEPLGVSAVDTSLPIEGAWHGELRGQIKQQGYPWLRPIQDHLDLTVSESAVYALWDSVPVTARLAMFSAESLRFSLTYFGPDTIGHAPLVADSAVLWCEAVYASGQMDSGEGLFVVVDCPRWAPVICPDSSGRFCWTSPTIANAELLR